MVSQYGDGYHERLISCYRKKGPRKYHNETCNKEIDCAHSYGLTLQLAGIMASHRILTIYNESTTSILYAGNIFKPVLKMINEGKKSWTLRIRWISKTFELNLKLNCWLEIQGP